MTMPLQSLEANDPAVMEGEKQVYIQSSSKVELSRALKQKQTASSRMDFFHT